MVKSVLKFVVCEVFRDSSCLSCCLGRLLLDLLWKEGIVLLIRTESWLSISIIRAMSVSPMNAVMLSQDVLRAWGT